MEGRLARSIDETLTLLDVVWSETAFAQLIHLIVFAWDAGAENARVMMMAKERSVNIYILNDR